ncbi:hypothetical protein KIL84_017932, partial [Mauremys mutica]
MRATGSEQFNVFDDFLTSHKLKWEACIRICTDGAPSMSGGRAGLKAEVSEIAPLISWIHHMIHHKAFATQNMDWELIDVLSSFKIVNFIKMHPTKAHLFAILCAEMEVEHAALLFHTEVRWLSRGKVLQCVYELRNEVQLFLVDVNFNNADTLCDPHGLVLLAYLADISDKLNSLNVPLQGEENTIFDRHKKISAFKRKLELWKTKIETGLSVPFPLLTDATNETESELLSVMESIKNHLSSLRASLDKYFPKGNAPLNDWIIQPFVAEAVTLSHLSNDIEEKRPELQSDRTLEIK